MKATKGLKVLLSLFILYHLSAVLLLPNPQSVLTRQWAFLFLPYANLLSLNTPWQFFAPDPSPHIYFEYEVVKEDPASPIETYRWPPKSKQGYITDNYYRLIYNSRFVTSSPGRVESFFVPWLCSQHPEAYEISIRSLSEQLMSIDKARIIGGPIHSLFEVEESRSISLPCESLEEEGL